MRLFSFRKLCDLFQLFFSCIVVLGKRRKVGGEAGGKMHGQLFFGHIKLRIIINPNASK